jgi:acetyltransferase
VSVRNLDKLFAPERVAVIGAGMDRDGVGHVVLGNLLEGDFEGVVYPVNPRRESVHGVQAYAAVGDTPEVPDLAVVCTPAAAVPDVVEACGEAGVGAVAVLSAGFREAGAEGARLEREVGARAAAFDGLPVLGPNCLGLLVPRLGLNASFAQAAPRDGHVAFVTQSGALASSVIDWAIAERIGFSHVVSLGNMLDVDLGDVIDYLGQSPATHSIILYVETVTNPRKFMSAARAFARGKPLVAYKAGRFPASAQASISHTGAMAGEDSVYDAAFERAGIVRVDRIEEVFATVGLLARQRPPAGPRLGIVTNAGGPGVMAADALLARGGALAELAPDSTRALAAALPPSASVSNPVDVLGDAPPERFGAAVTTLLADPGVDAVLTILTPQAMTDPAHAAEAVVAARGATRKPLLAAWLGGASVERGRRALADAGVAAYDYPEQAVEAFMHLVAYARNRRILTETPRALPVRFAPDRGRVEALMATGAGAGDGLLSEAAAKSLLDAYGIPVTTPLPARDQDEAVAVAERIGFPVVLKVSSPDITHKSDAGGVAVGIETPGAVRAAFDRIVGSVASSRPAARLEGVTVQSMVSTPGSELLLGARRDETFGAVLVLGAGGVAAEVLGDRSLALPPLNERLARRMLESLRTWPLLRGYRGRPPADLDALLEVLMRFSHLVADHPEIQEIEANPLLATGAGAIALDARAVIDRDLVEHPPPPFSHLAIRPYPQEYTREIVTAGGLPVTLRPIKPEDEPMWRAMLSACSLETIHRRFRGMVKHSHEMAARYCFIDYDRELAIVAELEEDGARRLAGVGRLVADPDHRNAEYAVLVADPWQGRGLSDALTHYCLEIATRWGVDLVYAETTPDNTRMLAVLRAHGFEVEGRPREGVVVGRRGTRTAPPADLGYLRCQPTSPRG